MSLRRMLMVLVAALACAGLALAQSHARIVRLSYVEGSVQMARGLSSGATQAFVNMPVNEGARVTTGANGRAEIQFEAGGTIRLAPDSSVEFPQLALADGHRETTARLTAGTAYFNLDHNDAVGFSLETGGREVTLINSSRFRVQDSDGELEFAVFKGKLDVTGNGQADVVKSDQTLSLAASAPPVLTAGFSTTPEDAWNKARDAYVDQYAYNSSYRSYSPYAYGLADLSYYGGFFNSPYGHVWQPYYVNSLWNPFMDGAWVYYPGFGYSWVSAYPWGWLPFHYGRWVFISGFGWGWQPGYWNAWQPVNTIFVNCPAGFRAPAPPVTPRGNGIVAVGGGPRFIPRGGATGTGGRVVLGAGLAGGRSGLEPGTIHNIPGSTGIRPLPPISHRGGGTPPIRITPAPMPRTAPPIRISPPVRMAPMPHMSAPSAAPSSGHIGHR